MSGRAGTCKYYTSEAPPPWTGVRVQTAADLRVGLKLGRTSCRMARTVEITQVGPKRVRYRLVEWLLPNGAVVTDKGMADAVDVVVKSLAGWHVLPAAEPEGTA